MVDLLERRAFVGRERELTRLLELFGEVEGGTGRTVIVGGEAGVGKTRLLARFAEAPGGRARCLTGACLPTETGGLPYGPFVEILRGIVRSTDPAQLPALLGPGRGMLTRLLPEIAVRDADVPTGAEADPTSQVRLFELIRGVVARLGREQPLILVIEDLHWADRSTIELLGFLARALRDDRVLIVVTVRTDSEAGLEADQTLRFVAELERDDGVERIDVEAFSRAEVADQVNALLADEATPAVVDRLFDRSDGNPFFVEELVLAGAADRSDLPAVVRDVLAARLAGLSGSARDVLRAATIGGRVIDEDLLAEVVGIDRRALASALREAVAAGVLERSQQDDAGPAVFRHALLREAVERELFPAERRALHRAFADALERREDDAPGSVPAADLARHWDGAHEPAKALRPMIAAANAAEAVYAWPEALLRWQRARAMFASVPDGESISGLALAEIDGRGADCALLAGDHAAAVALGRAAIDAVDAVADPGLAGVLHNRMRWYLWESGDRRGAAAAVETALRLIPAEPPSAERAGALAQYAGTLLFTGRYRESVAVAEEAISIARGLESPGELALGLGVLGWDLAALGDVDGGIARFREGQALAAAIGSAEGDAIAAINLATLLDRVGRSQEQLEAALTGYAAMERLGLTRTYGALLLGYAAKAQLVLGRWDDLDRTTADALRRGASERAEIWLSINRARMLVARGRLDAAASLLDRARLVEARLGGSEFHAALLLATGELAVARGDVQGARDAGAAGVELAKGGGPVDSSLAWLAILVVRAEADAADRHGSLGAQADAGREAVAARLSVIEGAIGEVLAERPELTAGGRSDAIRGLLQAERTRLEGPPAPARWATVADAWESLERPYAAAYARYREAEAMIAGRGSRDDAAELLRRARVTALELGAAPLAANIEALGRAARLPLAEATAGSPPPAGDPYGFTAREREVLELVADGRTNQQIAERLFITRKTASVHVSNVMAKLGAANRGEAAAMAHRLGIV